MTNVEKLVARLQRRPAEMRASEIETILNARGWTLVTRSGTSHRKWAKQGRDNIEYAVKDQMVSRVYLGKIARSLGLPEVDRR